MRTAPRVFECVGCGNRQRVAEPDTANTMALPPGWRGVGVRRNGLRRLQSFLCPVCAALATQDDNAQAPVVA